jgi:sterol desaturase/sphingolipid hydroxylase (fatty acid hydroxylase superfamily)
LAFEPSHRPRSAGELVASIAPSTAKATRRRGRRSNPLAMLDPRPTRRTRLQIVGGMVVAAAVAAAITAWAVHAGLDWGWQMPAVTGVALVLAAAAVVATFLVDLTAALWTLVAYAVFLAYFGLYSRHHLVAAAPEEEFEALAAASRDVR